MAKVFPFVAILFAGLMAAAEGATNGWMMKTAGSLYVSMVVCFALAALLLLVAAPLMPFRAPWAEVRALPWYAWAGGAYALGTVALIAWATPKLGAGPALVAALVAQTGLGLALDHFGVLGLDRSPVTLLKLAGFVVMLVGSLMIAVKN